MPIYSYGCKECNHSFDEIHTISDRNTPSNKDCPSCGVLGVRLIISTAPTLCASVNVTNKVPHFLKDRMREIKKDRGGTNMDHLI